MDKKPWQSKTIVLNAIFGVLASMEVFFPGATGVGSFIKGHEMEVTMAWSILNIVLRAVTKGSVYLVD